MENLLQKFKTTIILIYCNITIEPVVVLYLTSIGLNEVIRPNLLIDKACRQKLNFTASICDDINDEQFEDELNEVQKVVSNYEGTLSLLAFFPRIFYALVGGAWSDRHGRKPIIALPIIGQVLMNVTFLLNYFFLESLPFEMLYLEFLNEACGSFVLYYLAVYSYIADITTEAERTSRLSVLDGTDYIFTMVGTLLSGPVFKYLGYYATFGASGTLSSLAVLYVIFVVKESLGKNKETEVKFEDEVRNEKSKENHENSESTTYGTTSIEESPADEKKSCWSNFPRPNDLIAGFVTIFRRREEPRKRIMIWLLIFNFACYIFTYNGTEGSHRYLYAQKKYGWDEQEFTVYLSIYRVCYLITLWVLLPTASRYFHLHDATVAIIACITGSCGQLLPVITQPAWGFYAGSILNMLSPAATITARTMASRCVETEEIGRVFAVISLQSAISSSLVTAGYQAIYSATLESFPGMFLVVNAIFFLITVPNNVYLRLRLNSAGR